MMAPSSSSTSSSSSSSSAPAPVPDAARRISSYLTIQSDSKGQFGDLLRRIESSPAFPSLLSSFSTDPEEAHVLLALRRCLRQVRPRPVFRRKDRAAAEEARAEGNRLFRAGEVARARAAYSKSILCAPPEEAEDLLSVSYANRSACSFHLESYDLAVSDVHHALAHNYPREKRFKLYLRLAKCHLKLGDCSRAGPILQIARGVLAEGAAQEEHGQLQDLEEVEKMMRKCVEKCGKDPVAPDEKQPPTTWSKDDPFPDFSANLSVRHDSSNSSSSSSSSSRGRFVVARHPLRAGDVACAERAYASALYPERAGTHCARCLSRADAPVPCPGCAGAAFCSPACRDEAAGSFHRFECRFSEAPTGFGCSQVARLALRMVTVHPRSYFLRLRDRLASPKEDEENGGNEEGKDAYVRVFSLASNNAQRWPEDNFRRALMAALLLKILKAGGYFSGKADISEDDEEEEEEGEPSEEEVFIGRLLLRNLQVLQFNAHEVYESLRGSRRALKPWKSQSIALAVYPRCSYFNHSCMASVGRTFVGDRIVLTCLRPVDQGEELYENYGPTFYMKSRKERRLDLSSRYWFDCACAACRANWPLLAALPRREEDPSSTLLLSGAAGSRKAQSLMDRGRAREASRGWAELINERRQGSTSSPSSSSSSSSQPPPSEEAVRLEDKLRTCLSNMGNVAFVQVKDKKKGGKQ